jgi:NitT/TauT family transport system ATP-binding protein
MSLCSKAYYNHVATLKGVRVTANPDTVVRPALSGALHVSVRDLSHRFERRGVSTDAVAHVDLDVRQGEFVTILGPSGCGKSTLLRAIGGLLRPTSGTVSIAGADPVEARRRKSIGFAFQDPALLPWRTVIANIRLPLEVNAGPSHGSPDRLLDLIGLREFRDYYPHQLSGGMKQRVSLARALAHNPDLLLMDEPFGALDEITRSQMRFELQRLWSEWGKTVCFVTHSVPESVLLSDRVVVMDGHPGFVKAVVTIDLPRPRDVDVENSAAFSTYVAQLRALIRN